MPEVERSDNKSLDDVAAGDADRWRGRKRDSWKTEEKDVKA